MYNKQTNLFALFSGPQTEIWKQQLIQKTVQYRKPATGTEICFQKSADQYRKSETGTAIWKQQMIQKSVMFCDISS